MPRGRVVISREKRIFRKTGENKKIPTDLSIDSKRAHIRVGDPELNFTVVTFATEDARGGEAPRRGSSKSRLFMSERTARSRNCETRHFAHVKISRIAEPAVCLDICLASTQYLASRAARTTIVVAGCGARLLRCSLCRAVRFPGQIETRFARFLTTP